MCGAFGFSGFPKSINIFWRYYMTNKPVIRETNNIRPSMEALVVTRNSPCTGSYKRFGIKAPWSASQLLINAQSETVAEKKSFAHMFRESRCLIPATHFFEWKKLEDGKKQPYLFKLKNGEPYSFAGICNDEGFVILTAAPNSLMSPIHNRQPCILRQEDEEDYLNEDTEADRIMEILNPFPASEMTSFKVSSLVSSPKNQGPEVIKPL